MVWYHYPRSLRDKVLYANNAATVVDYIRGTKKSRVVVMHRAVWWIARMGAASVAARWIQLGALFAQPRAYNDTDSNTRRLVGVPSGQHQMIFLPQVGCSLGTTSIIIIYATPCGTPLLEYVIIFLSATTVQWYRSALNALNRAHLKEDFVVFHESSKIPRRGDDHRWFEAAAGWML